MVPNVGLAQTTETQTSNPAFATVHGPAHQIDFLSEVRLSIAWPTLTPMEPNHQLAKSWAHLFPCLIAISDWLANWFTLLALVLNWLMSYKLWRSLFRHLSSTTGMLLWEWFDILKATLVKGFFFALILHCASLLTVILTRQLSHQPSMG